MRLSSEIFSDREISALHRENTGAPYSRVAVIKDRFIEAKIAAALVPTDVCKFNNEWGFCKLDAGHDGKNKAVTYSIPENIILVERANDFS